MLGVACGLKELEVLACVSAHCPEVDRIWTMQKRCHGSFRDHILSTPGWLYSCRRGEYA